MQDVLSRIFHEAVRGDLDSLQALIPSVRRGRLSQEEFQEVEDSLRRTKKRFEKITHDLEAARQEWQTQELIWIRGLTQWHLQIPPTNSPLCVRTPVPRALRVPDFIGPPTQRSRTIPDNAGWPVKGNPQGIPICRQCLKSLYKRNEAFFHQIRDTFKRMQDDVNDL